MKTLHFNLEEKEFNRIKKAKDLDRLTWTAWIILSAERSFRENGRKS